MTSDLSASGVSRYEALRGGALGEPVAPDLRGGLTVLLRRGMWAWLRVVSAEPRCAVAPRQSDHADHRRDDRALVHLLADLASAFSGEV